MYTMDIMNLTLTPKVAIFERASIWQKISLAVRCLSRGGTVDFAEMSCTYSVYGG